jgi:hypothetical protein
MSLWLLEPRSTAVNGPILCSGFSVCAGQSIVRTTLGVKGSQVQILSSRRSYRSPLAWLYCQVGGLLSFRGSTLHMIIAETACGPYVDRW